MKVFGIVLLILCSMTFVGAAYLDLGCAYGRDGSYVMSVYSADLAGSGSDQILAGSDNGQIMYFKYVKCTYEWAPTWSHLQPASKKGTIVGMKVSDIDNDGLVELITAADTINDYIMVVSNDGGFFKWSEEKGGPLVLTFDVADMNNDGTDDIIYGNEAGSVVMLSKGKTVAWTTALGNPVYSVEAVDLNGDGSREIVALSNKFLDVANVYAIDSTGKILWNYQIDVGIYQASQNSISVGDANGDGNMEIAVATHKKGVLLLDYAGALLWDYQIDNTVTAIHIPESGGMVLAASNPSFYMLDGGGSVSKTIDVGGGGLVIQTADLSGDGSEEVILATKNKIMVFSLSGAKKGEWSIGKDVSVISMRIAELDGDGKKEIILGYGWDEAVIESRIKTGRLAVLEVTDEGGVEETTTTTRKSDSSTTTQATTDETTISKTTTTRYKPPQGTSTTKPAAGGGGGGFDFGMSGIIIIGVLGAGVLLLIVVAIVVLLFLKKKKKTESPPKEEKEATVDVISSIKEQVDSPPKEEKKKAAEKK
jgi:hypothetical protein